MLDFAHQAESLLRDALPQGSDAENSTLPDTVIRRAYPLLSNDWKCHSFVQGVNREDLTAFLLGLKNTIVAEGTDKDIVYEARHVIKNILLQKPELSWRDSNGKITAELVEVLDPKHRKEVLCQPGMINRLVSVGLNKWEDTTVIGWLNQYGDQDRLDILCTDGFLDALLWAGDIAQQKNNRVAVMRWVSDLSEGAKGRLVNAGGAAEAIESVFGKVGENFVKKYRCLTNTDFLGENAPRALPA